MVILSTENLKGCERQLQRAHHVLTFLVQFYTRTVPPTESINVPRSLTIPLLRVSMELQQAPFITYSDHALNNWSHKVPHEEEMFPATDNLCAQTTFTGTLEENEFHMTDIRIELKGAKAVESMRLAAKEIVDSDYKPDARSIAQYLNQAADAIGKMKEYLMSTKELVTPETFYNDIRPWLAGTDTDPWPRKWTWEGSEDIDGSDDMLKKTSGPTAAQSPLVPTLDAYLGLEEDERKSAFLDRVRVYMMSGHGAFLQHLRSNGRPIRLFVEKMARVQGPGSPVVSAYNAAVSALKLFRDAHLVIVTLYVIVPSRQAKAMAESHGLNTTTLLKSTGIEAEVIDHNARDQRSAKDACKNSEAVTKEEETNGSPEFLLMKFLKGLRDQTSKAGVN
jgi:indoleamine 2,3-dioxygenase